MNKPIGPIALSILFLLIPLHAASKDLPPTGQTPQKAVTPEGKVPTKPLPPSAPAQTTKPVIVAHQVRNLRSIPGGEEVEVVLTGKSLHLLTSARVMQGATEVREIKVVYGPRMPTGWTLRLSGRKEALGKAGLRLQLTGGGQRNEIPLSGELSRARSLAGLKETPAVPIPSEKQRELRKIKERERAMETARPLDTGTGEITHTRPAGRAADVRARIPTSPGAGAPLPLEAGRTTHQDTSSTRPAARAVDVRVQTPSSPGAGAPASALETFASPPRSMEFGDVDFVGAPFLRSVDFRSINFVGSALARSMELNNMDFVGIPDR